ncbi:MULTISPECIES: ferredoxin reductase family protein [Alphaproteobacteria]|uniref:Ferric reductase n=2 Tax=Alphaproteobacteria TaxID=28211 RepID=A0A512HH52_9HYPH|nr:MULTISPECIES: ferric reductase-like transmembrane domain-containing protein [Alphaproteobacteria]GEO84772.1 ferric reductase [Ciceribacter naphthalenivorans]GLR20607.1 ferric reductase [Ciceribacter naphthalenivorans]GLT03463.1 ferric reductase [Sphingomonas psychrolutea]
MSRLKAVFWGYLALLTILWLAASPDVFQPQTFITLRNAFIQYSGVLAFGCMTLAIILALRSPLVEPWLGGVDKMYRLHKWAGIGALVLSLVHWIWTQLPKWAVSLGLMAQRTRGERPQIEDPVQAFLMSMRGTAEGLGEWAFYLSVLLISIALIEKIPYRWFYQIHRLFPVLYLILAFHTIVLLDFSDWLTPLGAVTVIMVAAGSYAAIVSLFRRIGARRRVDGTIASMQHYPGVRSLETAITMETGWRGHKPGQFAFVVSDPREGAHPYTIASAWDAKDPKISFVTKELGDHTTGLVQKLKIGQRVRIEGPYGCFTFDDDCSRQIWIGGGIGITPFIARMKYLAQHPQDARKIEIDLFHSTRDEDSEALRKLAEDAKASNVRFHVLIESKHGRLTADRIREAVPDWQEASIWFCGPPGFGDALRADFAAKGMNVKQRFHQELFQMR